MSDKKHIDRLFQEKFKDFEVDPRNKVWDQIEAKLNKKKKKQRLIPIWWRYAGVAALLILLLTITVLNFNSNNHILPENQVVETESFNDMQNNQQENINSTDYNNANSVLPTDASNISDKETEVAASKEYVDHNSENDNLEKNNITVQSKNPIIHSESGLSPNQQTLVAKKEMLAKSVLESKDKVRKNNDEKPPYLSDNIKVAGLNKANENNLSKDKKSRNPNFDVNNRTESLENNMNTAVAVSESEKEENKEEEKPTIEKLELSIDEAIASSEKINEEEKFNRWSIAPNAAPVYFSTLGEGSSIDPQFNSNSKTGDINVSYGVTASYAISKKLKIRSGINKVQMGYNTNNVIAFQSIASSTSSLNNVKNIKTDFSLETVNGTAFISSENLQSKSNSSLLSNVGNASLNQELGFIEVPLELQYNLIDNKFGLNVIGGFSSLFLDNNKIYSEANNIRTFVGEANNLSNVSYSANFGFGISYEISRRFDLNLEPMFKYQLNTFQNTSGNFKPYFIGVYSGISIKF